MRQLQIEFEELENIAKKDEEPVKVYQLGFYYEFGIGTGQNILRAHQYYQKALKAKADIQKRAENSESPLVEFIWGCILCTEKQTEKEGVYWIYKVAQTGYAPAENYLGWLYQNGKGVDRNFDLAKSWYMRCAQKNYAPAQYNLAILYHGAKGVKQDYAEAFKWHTKAANAGHAAAQHKLGTFYRKGRTVAKSKSQGVSWYFESAKQKYIPAQRRLGICYRTGSGVTYDNGLGTVQLQEVFNYYRAAIDNGDLESQYKFALLMRDGKMIGLSKLFKLTDPNVFANFEKAANRGHAAAQNYVGTMYRDAIDVKKDPQKAIEWLTKSAEAGDPNGQANLGMMYSDGEGVKHDNVKALSWYHKAALQWHSGGMNNYGVMFLNGTGVKQDLYQAYFWLNRAKEQGYKLAGKNLKLIKSIPSDMNAQLIQLEARETETIKQKNLGAQKSLEEGFKQWLQRYPQLQKRISSPQTNILPATVESKLKEAAGGDAVAQDFVGWLYETGQGVTKNFEIAAKFYQLSAAQGNHKAQTNLGRCYANGIGVEQDYKKAVFWYAKAAEKGFPSAQYNLGIRYFQGQGVDKNEGVAIYLWRKAAAQKNPDAQAKLSSIRLTAALEESVAKAPSVLVAYREALVFNARREEELAAAHKRLHSNDSIPAITQAASDFATQRRQQSLARISEQSPTVSSHLSLTTGDTDSLLTNSISLTPSNTSSVASSQEYRSSVSLRGLSFATTINLKIIPYEQIELRKELGSGGFGVVHKAKWLTTTSVAYKQINLATSEDSIKAFKEESSILANFPGAYVVQVYGITEKPYGLVMEYMNQGSLWQRLRSQPEVTQEEKLRWAKQVVIALDFLHKQGLVHRDIKSSNILLKDNQIKLGDFGLSRLANVNTQSGGGLVGTPQWMAPELIHQPATFKSDIYSFGIFLWELVTGKVPYENVREKQLIPMMLMSKELYLDVPKTAPEPFKSLINDCCVLDPDKRLTAEEIITRFKGLRKDNAKNIAAKPTTDTSPQMSELLFYSKEVSLEKPLNQSSKKDTSSNMNSLLPNSIFAQAKPLPALPSEETLPLSLQLD